MAACLASDAPATAAEAWRSCRASRWYRWLEQHAPIPPDLLGQMRDAFFETGRGLFIGVGAAGLLQAIVATLAYLVLRVPHALELGLLTFCCSVIPSVGTALVWAPVAAGLALEDLGPKNVQVKLLFGVPWHAIVEESRRDPTYDVIVMGTHGRSGIRHVLLGSVAERVARHANCPVLLIRSKAAAS